MDEAQRRDSLSLGDRSQRTKAGKEGRMSEPKVGIDPDSGTGLVDDARFGPSVDLSHPQVLAIRG